MTNRLEINWKLDGFVGEQRYYCSETPIDPQDSPAPKVVLAGDARTYTDTAIEVDRNYYVCIGSVKNGFEKISANVMISTKDYSKYTAFFELNNLVDKKGGASLISYGDAVINDGAAYFDGVGDWLQRPDTIETTFGTGSLTVQCEFKCGRLGTHSSDQVLIDNFIASQGGWQLGINPQGKAFLYLNTPSDNVIVSTLSYSDGNWHKLKWTREGNLNTLYIDGISVGTYTDQRNFAQRNYVAIGAQVNHRNAGYDFKGWIRNIGYAKQVL